MIYLFFVKKEILKNIKINKIFEILKIINQINIIIFIKSIKSSNLISKINIKLNIINKEINKVKK